jgi:LAO/AO transport system kinase
MTELSRAPEAFVRPSPSSGATGGLSRRTREALVVLEAGGFDVLIVETVGTGQAEVAVTELVDVLVVVLLAGAGDDVQGVKRGLLEHADLVVFNKADGENLPLVNAARDQLSSLYHWMRKGRAPSVLASSARENRGVEELWQLVEQRFQSLLGDGELERRRRAQRRAWFERALEEALLARFSSSAAAAARLELLTEAVESGQILPRAAARQLLESEKNPNP